jgi:hypothetical protein
MVQIQHLVQRQVTEMVTVMAMVTVTVVMVMVATVETAVANNEI